MLLPLMTATQTSLLLAYLVASEPWEACQAYGVALMVLLEAMTTTQALRVMSEREVK